MQYLDYVGWVADALDYKRWRTVAKVSVELSGALGKLRLRDIWKSLYVDDDLNCCAPGESFSQRDELSRGDELKIQEMIDVWSSLSVKLAAALS